MSVGDRSIRRTKACEIFSNIFYTTRPTAAADVGAVDARSSPCSLVVIWWVLCGVSMFCRVFQSVRYRLRVSHPGHNRSPSLRSRGSLSTEAYL